MHGKMIGARRKELVSRSTAIYSIKERIRTPIYSHVMIWTPSRKPSRNPMTGDMAVGGGQPKFHKRWGLKFWFIILFSTNKIRTLNPLDKDLKQMRAGVWTLSVR